MKRFVFSVFQRITRALWGTGIGKLPGAYAIHGFLFQMLRPNQSVVEIQGSKMFVDPRGLPHSYRKTFQSYILSSGTGWEELTTTLFKQTVKEGNVVLDLGANIGYFSLLAARLVGEKGRVYSFEPEPTNYSLLKKNIELNGYRNITAMQKAISNASGKVRLFVDGSDTGGHTIYQRSDSKKVVEIDAIMLDEFFKDKERRIDVIKMDIEGAEMAALSGMERIIRENKDLKIFMEFYFAAIKRAGNSPEEFCRKLLEDYRFSIQAMGDYTRDRKYVKINTVADLMELCKGERTANLFMEKRA